MDSEDPSNTVRERMSFFEHLCKDEVKSSTLRRVRPTSTTSLPQGPIPPQKPKRTFMHTFKDIQNEGLKRGTDITCNEWPGNAPSSTTNNNTYDVPNIERKTRFSNRLPKFEPAAYYACVPVESANNNGPCVTVENGNKTSSTDSDATLTELNVGLLNMSTRTCRLNRTPGFKSKPRTPNSKRSVEKKSEREKSLQKYKNRAKKQRRRTLEEKDRNMAAMCGAKPRLFESVLIVSLEPSLGCGEAAIMKPTVSYRFPEDQAGADVSPELFFPDYTHAQKTRFCREEFVLALTDEAGKRKNAYCHKFLPPEYEKVGGYPAVLVVISPIRNDIFYLDVARTIRKYLEKSYDHLTSFLTSIVRHNYPQNRGASLVVVEKSSSGRPNRFEIFNHGTILGRTDCSKVIERISPEVTACVIAALLGEQRVLLAERTVCMASKLVQVMEALIQPFCWPHVFIPAVPDNLLDLCHNPTPYLMGILRNNLAPIHDLIVADQHNKNELDQMDFVFIDASNGLINPPPEPFLSDGDVAAWKLETALSFCERLGMPRKACMALITGFRNAISSGTGSAADLRVETVMLSWYASLFGHYKTVCCQCDWGGALFKQRLVEMQPDKSVRPYLSYLVETVMFHEWIMKRTSKEILPPDPLPGSEEYLNRRIDKLYAAGVNSFATKPLAKMFNKVTNVLRAKK